MKATDRLHLINRISSINGLTDHERAALLKMLRDSGSCGLVWEDRPEEIEKRLGKEMPVLIEDPTKALTDATDDAPNHILIEGDNLGALTALSYTHAESIDVIYIDPPYNTGKEFIYNDNFTESKRDCTVGPDDPFRHSKWISFMKKRLDIAHKLLKRTGCLIVSIDDNEQAHLKMLLDKVFRPENFSACFCVIRAEGGGLAKQVIKGHDYCMVYARDINAFKPLAKQKDVRGKIITKDGVAYWIQEDWLRKEFGKYGNCHYEELVEYKGEEFKREVDRCLATGEYTLIPKSNGMHIIGKLRRLDTDSSKYYSVIKHLNKDGVKELRELQIDFDYPKPTSLIRELVGGATFFNHDAVVLDFFAGSGTTLHATMQLNAEDGGHRRCILCTNNENSICENVTYERNKRVINGYTKPDGEYVEGLHDNNLRYYRTEYVSRERTQKNRHLLMEKATDMLCIKENLHDEQTTFGRIKLNPGCVRFFAKGDRRMLVIYYPEIIPFFVSEIEKFEVSAPIKIYLYSPGRYAFEDEFSTVSDKVNPVALPESIIQAMSRVMPADEYDDAQD